MKPELLSPAGSYDAALAAFQYGADAVYAGLPHFSARAEAQNITMEELRLLSAYARTFSPAKKIYITFNTLLFDHELPPAFEMLDQLDELRPDAIIVQDLGAARLIRENFPHIPLHASTQMAAHNLDSVLALKELGFKRVVLARELSMPEISHIAKNCGIEIEVFVHGALCYSYSGLCLFSSQTTGRSGNRGRCAYCCRHSFTAGPEETHPFSMKDLSLLPILDDLRATGLHSLKIEGRMKNPLYVACVTDAYRRKLDGKLPPGAEKSIISDMQTVFSRPWTQLYTENTAQIPASVIDPETIGHRGAQIGRVNSVFKGDDNRRWLRFKTTRELEKHDGIQIDVKETERPFGFGIQAMRRRGEEREQVVISAGTDVEIEILDSNPPLIDKSAKVYCSSSQAVHRNYKVTSLRASELDSGTQIDISVTLKPYELLLTACIAGDKSIKAEHSEAVVLEPAKNADRTEAGVRKACERLGNTIWSLHQLTLSDEHQLYIPPAILNNARRELMDKLELAQLVRRKERAAVFGLNLLSDAPLEPAECQPLFTLKTRIFAPLPSADYLQKFSTVVLDIGHRSARQTLENLKRWKELLSENQRIVLAIPLITRLDDHNELEKCVAHLIAQNLTDWEVADLSGYHLLKTHGITPVSADWTLYCMNRMASAVLKELGFQSQVISPELIDINSIFARTAKTCEREYLIFQHTPLYISASAPAVTETPDDGLILLADRGGRDLVTYQRDREWITTAKKPIDREDKLEEALSQGISRFRVDWSWSAG